MNVTTTTPRIGRRSINEANMTIEERTKLAIRRRQKAEASRACNARKRAIAKGLEICPSVGYKKISLKKDVKLEDLRFSKTEGDITTSIRVQRAGAMGMMMVTKVQQEGQKATKQHVVIKDGLEAAVKIYNKAISQVA
jgi:hypothetical protein